MSMELRLFSDRRLGTVGEWQNAIGAEHFPLQLSDATPLGEVEGFLPVHLRGNLTGFECNHWDAKKVMAEYPGVNFGHNWKYALALRWLGSKRDEMLAAWMAATAYARATDGIVFDEMDGKIRTASQALAIVHDLETDDQHIVDAAVANALSRLRSRSQD
ncbi:MAG: hypothetical protein WBD53_19515 [Xanthobacteraceae bacterium]